MSQSHRRWFSWICAVGFAVSMSGAAIANDVVVKRFSGEELVGKEKCELRLLPQPIDRYTPSATDRADGAIFIAAYGTNPEAVLFIESDGKSWNYAAGRLAGATTISLSIDGATAWEGAPVKYGSNSPYTASNAPADIPGISPDGTEIKE